MARSIGRPIRYFIAKRPDGPNLIIAERIDTIFDYLKREGLETVHPEILVKLNKKMTLDDFGNSVSYIKQHGIVSRAFILLNPPFLSESEGIYWAKKSIEFAFTTGVECCTIIPVRSGNGAMETLLEQGYFSPPDIHSLETVLEYGIKLNAGRVFADVWDIGQFSRCSKCIDQRTNRLIAMNLSQKIIPPIKCACDHL